MRIAVIGYGGVGRTFVELLQSKRLELLNDGLDIQLNYIIGRIGGVYSPDGIDIKDFIEFSKGNKDFSFYLNGGSKALAFKDILENKDVDLVVEATPTNLKDGEPGTTHLTESLRAGFNVVTANKGPIVLHYKELKEIAIKNNVQLGIGCTTGGALSSINAGIFDMAGANIEAIEGVLNGTTNYIINLMETEKIEYDKALKRAQELGIAETEPKLDVEGIDTATKLLILTNVLLNKDYKLEDIEIEGITDLKQSDIDKVLNEGKKYKLIGRAIKNGDNVEMNVKLESIGVDNPFYTVDGKNKAVRYISDTLGDLTIIGGASGLRPAAASILRDIINIHRGNKLILNKGRQ
ncbi:MAG: homoserine dehydrogenase [Tissierellia bacterium]|nr:homoserine dehydrogenase [Tissierellia bacterium]